MGVTIEIAPLSLILMAKVEYVSKLKETLQAMPKSWRGSKDQLLAFLKKRGVKQEEIDYSEYFQQLPDGVLDKDTALNAERKRTDSFDLEEIRTDEWLQNYINDNYQNLGDDDLETLEYAARAEHEDVILPDVGDIDDYWENLNLFTGKKKISGSKPPSSHYDIDSYPGYISHARGNSGEFGGRPARIVQELQSDLHGFKQDQYGDTPVSPEIVDTLQELKGLRLSNAPDEELRKAYDTAYEKLRGITGNDNEAYMKLLMNPSKVDEMEGEELTTVVGRLLGSMGRGEEGVPDLPYRKNWLQKGIERQLGEAAIAKQDMVVPLRSAANPESPPGLHRGAGAQRLYDTKVPSQLRKVANAQGLSYDEFEEAILDGNDSITYGRIKTDPEKKLRFEKYVAPLTGTGLIAGGLGTSEEAEASPLSTLWGAKQALRGGDEVLSKKILDWSIKNDPTLDEFDIENYLGLGERSGQDYRDDVLDMYEELVNANEGGQTSQKFSEGATDAYHGTAFTGPMGDANNPLTPFGVGPDDASPFHLGTAETAHEALNRFRGSEGLREQITLEEYEKAGLPTKYDPSTGLTEAEYRDAAWKLGDKIGKRLALETPYNMHRFELGDNEIGAMIDDTGLEDQAGIAVEIENALGIPKEEGFEQLEGAKDLITYRNDVEAPGSESAIITPSTRMKYKHGVPVAVGSGMALAGDETDYESLLDAIPKSVYSDRTKQLEEELPIDLPYHGKGYTEPTLWDEVRGIPGAIATGAVTGVADLAGSALGGIGDFADWLVDKEVDNETPNRAQAYSESIEDFIQRIENEQKRRGYDSNSQLLGEFVSPI